MPDTSPPVEMPKKPVYLKISATQLETFAGSRESCNRKWFFGSVRRLPTVQNNQAQFGTRFHSILERHFKGNDHGDPLTGAPVDLYPNEVLDDDGNKGPWNAGLTPLESDLAKRLIEMGKEEGLLAREPDYEVEKEFLFRLIDTPELVVDVVGYRDLLSRSKWLVVDHKTTGSGYAKSETTLPRTTQMQLYALSLVVEFLQAGGKPENLPEKVYVKHNVFNMATSAKMRREGRKPEVWAVGPVGIPVRRVDSKHFDQTGGLCEAWKTLDGKTVCVGCVIYYKGTDGKLQVDPKTPCSHCGVPVGGAAETEEDQPTPSLEEALDKFTATARAMAEVSKIQTWTAVPGPLNVQAACNAYGQLCHFARICGGQESEEAYRKRLEALNQPKEVEAPASTTPPTEPAKEVPVSALAALRARANGANSAGPPAQPPQAAAPTPSTPPVQAPPAQAPLAPTPGGGPNRLAALLRAQPPVVNPNPVPPEPPTQPHNPAQQRMPWGIAGCRACGGVGVSSSGNPCMPCDDLTRQQNGPTSDKFIWKFENGLMSIVSNKDGSPVAPKAQDQGPVAAGTMNGQPTVFTQEAPKAPYGPEGAMGYAQKPAETVTTLTAPANPSPAGATTLTASAPDPLMTTAPVAPPPKKRGRPPKKKDVAVLTPPPANGQPQPTAEQLGAPDEDLGFTLCIGCRPTKTLVVQFDDVWSQNGAALAKSQNAASFSDLKPFERADRLVGNVTQIVEMLHGSTVYVPAEVTVEQRGLVSALRTLASEVYEA